MSVNQLNEIFGDGPLDAHSLRGVGYRRPAHLLAGPEGVPQDVDTEGRKNRFYSPLHIVLGRNSWVGQNLDEMVRLRYIVCIVFGSAES